MKWEYNTFAGNGDIPTKFNQALMFVMSSIQFSLKLTKYWWHCIAHFHLLLTPLQSYYHNYINTAFKEVKSNIDELLSTPTHTHTYKNRRVVINTYTHTYTCTVLWPSWILSGTIRVSRHQKGNTRKVKPIWIYRSKRQWVAVASAVPHAHLHLDTHNTHNTTVLRLCGICPGKPGWAGTRRNIHPLLSS